MKLERDQLETCCDAPTWASVVARGHYASLARLLDIARETWWQAVRLPATMRVDTN